MERQQHRQAVARKKNKRLRLTKAHTPRPTQGPFFPRKNPLEALDALDGGRHIYVYLYNSGRAIILHIASLRVTGKPPYNNLFTKQVSIQPLGTYDSQDFRSFILVEGIRACQTIF